MTRAQHIHIARVLLTESIKRRGQPFAWTLLVWAGNARRRAMAAAHPAQGELFGAAA